MPTNLMATDRFRSEDLSLNAATALHLLDRAERFARWGRTNEAAEAYREACLASVETAERYRALLGLAGSLDTLGDGEGATEACREAISQAPDRAAAYGVLALCLMHHAALDEAAIAATRASRCDDGGPAMLCLLATVELRREKIKASMDAVEAALALEPDNTRARALQRLGEWCRDPNDARLNWQSLVRVTRPKPPTSFASLAAFNTVLAAAICDECAALPGPPGGPLVAGDRLDDVFSLPQPLAAAIRELLVGGAETHATSMLGNGGLGALGTSPSSLTVRGWANVMQPGSYERPHIHEEGRFSCVYYVELPGPGSTGGELVFGPHDLGSAVPAPPPFRITPVTGMMIHFPSWLYHSTLPFSGRGRRISVAADIVASDA